MTTATAFEHFLNTVGKKINTGTIGSWRTRLKKGILKEETMRELLLSNGYSIQSEAVWISPIEKQFEFFICNTDKIMYDSVVSKDSDSAIDDIRSKYSTAEQIIDITNFNKQDLIILINNTIL